MIKSHQGRITNWSLAYYLEQLVIVGVIKFPTNEEEHFIRTSAIVHLSPYMVETQNSIYTLGQMVKS